MSLFNAISKKDIQQCIKQGEDVNMQNSLGLTPLHKWVAMRRVGAIESLLELGANPNIRNSMGQTPLHIVKQNKKDEEIIKLLLKHRANAFLPDFKGNIPFSSNSIINQTVSKRFN